MVLVVRGESRRGRHGGDGDRLSSDASGGGERVVGGWLGYGPSQERAAHFAHGHAGCLRLRRETFDISLPAPREHLGVIQTRAVLTEQLESHHFRFRELIRIGSANG